MSYDEEQFVFGQTTWFCAIAELCYKPNNLYGNLDRMDGKRAPYRHNLHWLRKSLRPCAPSKIITKDQKQWNHWTKLQGIKAFLTDRSQRVRVEQEFSSWSQVKSGIPQGSVLGPILFVIFINDMSAVVESFCQLFADNAKIFNSICSSEDNRKLQCDLDKLSDWAEKWQLYFNTDKCKSFHIGRTNKRQVYQMNGNSLDQVMEEKDLGVIIDHELKFHQQTAASVKKTNHVLGLIKKSFSNLDETTLSLLYKTLVRPHLEYANVAWGPHFKGDIKLVERVQRRATKLVQQYKTLPYEDRRRALELPSLVHRRRGGDMIFTYKLMTGKTNIDKDIFFKFTNRKPGATVTRYLKSTQLNCLAATRIQTRLYRLPKRIVEAISVDAFKERLDEHWKNGVMYDTPF